ncbi:MAG: DNA polymerase III subunit delta [Balneolaceae bacterium]|nr:MAG: DNA polymerase III subunit delta [Balneolaceae bacterium]
MARNRSESLNTFRTFYQELKSQSNLKPVYYLYGDEIFLVDMLQELIENIIPEGIRDFNMDLIYGGETTADRVLNIAASYPMMSDRRVVIVRDFLKLNQSAGGEGIADFIPYLKNPSPTTILCLIDQKHPDKRSQLGKLISSAEKSGKFGVAGFEKVDQNQLPDWIMKWARHSHKREMAEDAAWLLSELTGPDLKLLSTEIDKLCTFVDSDSIIKKEHVKKVTESYREYDILELKNAVIARDLNQSLRISEQMLQRSNNSTGEIFKTVGFFYFLFSNIWKICKLRDSGLDKSQMKEQLGLSNFAFNLNYSEASRFHLNEMPAIFEAILDADRSLKGFSTMNPPDILLLLIKRITG